MCKSWHSGHFKFSQSLANCSLSFSNDSVFFFLQRKHRHAPFVIAACEQQTCIRNDDVATEKNQITFFLDEDGKMFFNT